VSAATKRRSRLPLSSLGCVCHTPGVGTEVVRVVQYCVLCDFLAARVGAMDPSPSRRPLVENCAKSAKSNIQFI